jgi:putative transposase
MPGTCRTSCRASAGCYVRHVNDAHRRTGTLWEGRDKACPLDSDVYLMRCHRYVELNPVRAAMVAAPQDYPWSSYRANGLGEADSLVCEHALYGALGATPAERREAYRASFAEVRSSRRFASRPMVAGRRAVLSFATVSPPRQGVVQVQDERQLALLWSTGCGC